jgi:hypothetical protein
VRDPVDRKRESNLAATAAKASAANAHGFWNQDRRVSSSDELRQLPARKPRVF